VTKSPPARGTKPGITPPPPASQPNIPTALLIASVGALALVGALGWTAAEGGRGLTNADLRTVMVVTIAVFAATWVATRTTRRSG
jgi:hypothetical protein